MGWRSLLLLGTVSLGLIVIEPVSNLRAQSAVVWSTGFEDGSEVDWYGPDGFSGGEFNSGCAGASPIRGFGRNPSGADPYPVSLVLTTAAPCGALAESGTRMFRFLEPRLFPDLYYMVWYYIPQTFTFTDPVNPWWILMSWKSSSTTPARNDPFFNVTVGNRADGNMFISLYEPKPYDPANATSHAQTLVNVPVAQWFYIEALYKSRGNSTGQVTVWQGDEASRTLLWDIHGVQTRYPDSEGGGTDWAVTSYANGIDPVPAQFAIDDVEIRTP